MCIVMKIAKYYIIEEIKPPLAMLYLSKRARMCERIAVKFTRCVEKGTGVILCSYWTNFKGVMYIPIRSEQYVRES